MTLPKNVQDALADIAGEAACRCDVAYTSRGLKDPQCVHDLSDSVETIRAHLLDQDAEIARLNAECRQHLRQAMENGCAANLAESSLAAADALLRDLYARFDRINHDEDGDAYINESHYGMRNIEAYRKGAGSENAHDRA